MTDSERIHSRCRQIGDCLVWQGATNGKGHGITRIGGRKVYVHRACYAEVNGPIPSGLQIDHVKARGCDFVCAAWRLKRIVRCFYLMENIIERIDNGDQFLL